MIAVTAFGPFAGFPVNPSEKLGRAIFGDSLIVLPVSFAAVDEFVANLSEETTRLLMLGVARKAHNLRLERTANDEVGAEPDVCSEVRTRSKCLELHGSLFDSIEHSDCWEDSTNAGNYLCNYLYYETTKAHPTIKTGFVHVPPLTVVPFSVQAVRLKRLSNLLSFS